MNDQISDPLPAAFDAEKAVLACVLLDPGCFFEVRAVLDPEAFHLPAHRLLWNIVSEMAEKGQPIDALTLQQVLIDRRQLEEVGGGHFVLGLFTFIPVAAHWPQYAEIISEKAVRRRGMNFMTRCWRAFFDSDVDWRETVAVAQAGLSQMLADKSAGKPVGMDVVMERTIALLEERFENKGRIVGGLLTGFTDLDRMFLGIPSPHIVTIAGRPSMGKSVLLWDFALNIGAGQGHYDEFDQPPKRVLFISTEMDDCELGSRAVANRSGTYIKRFADGFVNQDDFLRVVHVAGELAGAPISIAYRPGITAEQIAALIQAWDAQHPDTAAYVIDHMTDVGCDAVKDKGNQTAITTMAWAIVSDAVKRVKKVAFLGCQVNRDGHGRLPVLTDLKQSGAIEEKSNIVLMVHRPFYYEAPKPEEQRDPDADPNEGLVIVSKNRNGRQGPVKVTFQGEITRFSSRTSRLYTLDEDQRQEKLSFASK